MANKLLRTKLNTPSAEQNALPFYNLLPKDKVGLLQWRIYARERALVDLEFRECLRQAFATDIAFFAATCIWIHETRPVPGNDLGKFPLFPDCDQVDLLAWLAKHAGTIDMTISKTRGIGLSYLLCIVVLWLWLFHGEKIEFAMVTKDLLSLDVKDRPSSLLGKMDLLFEELPAWLKVDDEGKKILHRTTTNHNFQNLVNGNMISGFAATDDKLRSGRFYLVVLDEAAFFPSDIQRWIMSAIGVTYSVIWLSTFDGTSNMFFRIATSDDPGIDVIRIETWWWDNPRWAAGRYVSRNGQIEILDQTYKFEDYQFSHDDPGLERSPLVDAAFKRPGADKQRVKEELYGIAVQDSRKLFSSPRILKMFADSVKPPVWIGDYEDGEWVVDENGPIQLWVLPQSLTGIYAVGCDPSLGGMTGAKAGLAGINVKTGLFEVCARFEGLDQVAFAQKAVKICKAMCGPRGAGYATLAWETTGIGAPFTSEVARLRYPAVWYDPGKSSPGCHNQDRGEAWLLEAGRAIADGDAIIKSGDCISEFKAWEYDRKFDLCYAGVDGHGDLGIAAAIAWRAAAQRRKAMRDADKRSREKSGMELNEYRERERKKSYSDMFETRKRRA